MFALHRKSACALIILLVSLLTLTSCVGNSGGVFSFAVSGRKTAALSSVPGLHSSDVSELKYVSSSGLMKMYFDYTTCSVSVYDSTGDTYWTSLPQSYSETASVLKLTVSSSEKVFYLNTQDNSVAYKSYSVSFGEDSVTVTYYISDNADTVKKATSSLAAGEVYVIVPVVYTLKDGNFFVDIDCSEIFVSDGYILENIELLPYFGAVSYAQTENAGEASSTDETETQNSETEAPESGADAKASADDFILVPDGCGALMYTDTEDATTAELSFTVYGDNADKSSAAAPVGAYGIKKNNCAYTAVITAGEAQAVIRAKRSSVTPDKANIVYADFTITSCAENNSVVYYSEPYSGKISVCCRFMSGSEANYISMAAACREQLIRNGVLSSKTVTDTVLPLNISVIGSVDGGKTVTATFEETEDMLSVIKAKGINAVNLIYKGMYNGGLAQKKASSLSVLSKLGGEASFSNLCEYALKQKFNVYSGINLLTSSSAATAASAKTLTGNTMKVGTKNPLSPYIGKEEYSVAVLSAAQIENNVVTLMNKTKGLNFDGYYIPDAADALYADYSASELNRTAVSGMISDNIASFATRKNLMLSGCNFNVIKTASMLTDVPLHTSFAESAAYTGVPFVMAILHSTVEYSGKPANSYSVPKLEMLKCIEYGAVPYFEWVFDMNSNLYYGYNLADVVDFCLSASQKLSDLVSARITGHEQTESGVFCTHYDSGSLVYVNYNNYSVAIGDISVMPYDYIRIN